MIASISRHHGKRDAAWQARSAVLSSRPMPATKKKSPAKKPATTRPAAKRATPSPEHQAATAALKLVDEAADLLRRGISSGSKTTEAARLEAKKKAHSLLNKASSSLADVLGNSTSVLRKVINKI